jgi:hypothetical protein
MFGLRLPISAISLSVLLAACGGGGDSDPADKYVGSWEFPCTRDGSSSSSGTLTLNRASDTATNGTLTARGYNNTTCAGSTPTVVLNLAAAVNVQGTGTVSGRKVDKVTYSFGSTSGRDIFYVEGNRLFSSPENSAVDAEGYPTSLDLSSSWTRN